MANEQVSNFLGDLRDEVDDSLAHAVISFEDNWERKLWHELTEILLEFYADPKSAKQRLQVYDKFVKTFADKINQLKLVKIALGAASQIPGEYGQYMP